MPTSEFKPLLDRAAAPHWAAQLIELACPLLREVTNKATWVFRLCTSEGAQVGGENEDLATLTLYRHLIEIVDGIEVLFRSSCVGASVPLVRAEFEALLSLEYILQTEKECVRRSLCWSCAYLHSRIDLHRRLDRSTDIGSEFAAALRSGSETPTVYSSAEGVAGLERVLARDEFRPIEAEYQRCKRARKRRPEWFELFNGPRNRRLLANAVDQEAEYLSLYRELSGFSHALDASPYIRGGRAPGEAAFLAVRSAHNMQHWGMFAAMWLVRATRITLRHFRPGLNLTEWYRVEVKPLSDALRTMRVSVNEEFADDHDSGGDSG